MAYEASSLGHALKLLLGCGMQGRPSRAVSELTPPGTAQADLYTAFNSLRKAVMSDQQRANSTGRVSNRAFENQNSFSGFLLSTTQALSLQPACLSYPSQTCPLCPGRLVSSLQHAKVVTLLTTQGPVNARLVEKQCKSCGLRVAVHTAKRRREPVILWLNMPLNDCGVMRVHSRLYIEVALLQQFTSMLLNLNTSYQRLSETYVRMWATGPSTHSLSRDGQELMQALQLYFLAQADWVAVWEWEKQQAAQHTQGSSASSHADTLDGPLQHASVAGSLRAMQPRDGHRVLMEFAYHRGKHARAAVESSEEEGEGEGESEADDERASDRDRDSQGVESEGSGGANEGAEEDIEDLVRPRDADDAGAEDNGPPAAKRDHTSAETGSITGHCRTLMAYKLEQAGCLGACHQCTHPNCSNPEVRVWLLDGTDASGPLAMHICNSDGCQRPPRARNQPRDVGKLLCEHHHKQQEQEQQQQQQQQDQSASAASGLGTATYSGGARLGGVNGLFAPCGHVLGLLPQYGSETPENVFELLERVAGTTQNMPQVVIYNDALKIFEHLETWQRSHDPDKQRVASQLRAKWAGRLCIDVLRFKQLYAGTFAAEEGECGQSLRRRQLLGLLSPFAKLAMVTELACQPASAPQPDSTQPSTSNQHASQQGDQAAHRLTWSEIVQRAPELLMNPHGHVPWRVHQVSEPCAIQVKPAALQKLGFKGHMRSSGSGYDYLQVIRPPSGQDQADVSTGVIDECHVKVLRLHVNTSQAESGWRGLGLMSMSNLRSMTHDHALLHLFLLADTANKQRRDDAVLNAAHAHAVWQQQQQNHHYHTQQDAGPGPSSPASLPTPVPDTPSPNMSRPSAPGTSGSSGSPSLSSTQHSMRANPRSCSSAPHPPLSANSPGTSDASGCHTSPLSPPLSSGVQSSARQASLRSPPAQSPNRGSGSSSDNSNSSSLQLNKVQYWRQQPRQGHAARLVSPAVHPGLFGLRQQLGLVDYWPKKLVSPMEAQAAGPSTPFSAAPSPHTPPLDTPARRVASQDSQHSPPGSSSHQRQHGVRGSRAGGESGGRREQRGGPAQPSPPNRRGGGGGSTVSPPHRLRRNSLAEDAAANAAREHGHAGTQQQQQQQAGFSPVTPIAAAELLGPLEGSAQPNRRRRLSFGRVERLGEPAPSDSRAGEQPPQLPHTQQGQSSAQVPQERPEQPQQVQQKRGRGRPRRSSTAATGVQEVEASEGVEEGEEEEGGQSEGGKGKRQRRVPLRYLS